MTTHTRTAPSTSGGSRTGDEQDAFQFRLEFYDDSGQVIGSEPLARADFQRAVAETTFAAFRAGQVGNYAPDLDAARVEPIFRQDGPSERTEGFRVTIPCADGRPLSLDYGVGYLAARAGRLKARIARERGLAEGASLYYTLAAYLDDAPPPPPRRGLITAGPQEFLLQVSPRRRLDLGPLESWDTPDSADMSVVIPRSVLVEAVEEARAHPDREIGCLLLGRLHRDTDREPGDLFLEVTCLVSCEGTTPATVTSVTFTPESFARAREMIRLRSRPGRTPETIVGWCHSHPFRFCDQCPLPTPPECLQKVLFYSSDDLNVMESAFGQPYHVGLLAAVEPRIEGAIGHLPVKLFGWRSGETVARGFDVASD